MIIQLEGYPIIVNGFEIAAETAEDFRTALLTIRSIMLFESDWTQTPDNPISGENKALWAEFRQMLRDLSTTAPTPLSATVEISDPPTWGCPASWVNLTPEAYGHSHH
jgi:hypothetical protein